MRAIQGTGTLKTKQSDRRDVVTTQWNMVRTWTSAGAMGMKEEKITIKDFLKIDVIYL